MLKILTLLITLFFSNHAFAVAQPMPSAPAEAVAAKSDKEASYQQIIDEYKAYLTTVDKSVREEIVTFRKEIARLNKQKHSTYKKLSQEAQHYLAKERELKRRLPIEQRKNITDNAEEE